MKAFIYSKYLEDQAEKVEFLDYKNKQIEIDNESEFNKITIYNPGDTNRIYTINNIKVKLDCENIMLIKMGTADRSSITINENDKSSSKLKLVYNLNDNNIIDKNIEIFTVKIPSQEYVDLLLSQYIILLPKGQITINMKKEIKKLSINIDYIDEII